ncbi:unnamed protein product [Pleuronectes platessa]|uniref:Uncharacterized protein n=1 Tax=Pleuronectes platessa TaxID=8262 RepID=A0A9N7VXN0_PLEPL|nr:unnamed protein product [Pleuronectes platessa]
MHYFPSILPVYNLIVINHPFILLLFSLPPSLPPSLPSSHSSHSSFPCAGGNPNSFLTAVDELRHYVTGSGRARQPALTSVSMQSGNQAGRERPAGATSNIHEASAA